MGPEKNLEGHHTEYRDVGTLLLGNVVPPVLPQYFEVVDLDHAPAATTARALSVDAMAST